MRTIQAYVRTLGVVAAVAAGCGPGKGETNGNTSDATGEDPTEDTPTTASDPTDADPTGDGQGSVVISQGRGVDVLFVIDNSGSMAEEQALLAAGMPAFIDVLEAPDLRFDYRIGVTTTDSGNPRCPSATFTPEGGKLVLSSCLDRVDAGEFTFNGEDFSFACSDFCTKRNADLLVKPTGIDVDDGVESRNWVERSAGLSNIGGVADNVEALRCYLPMGVAGCGFESHLESMYLALASAQSNQSKSNFGFLRDAAQLGVIFVSDETDCSWSPAAKEIFTTNKVFWNSPDEAAPTSALCWRAGVACTGGPGVFSECHAENHDLNGDPGAADAGAVLQPISKYIDFLQQIEDTKRQIDVSQEVQVALISGVPVGYEKFESELVYEDSPDPFFQDNFGVGPGCVLGDPNQPLGAAVPPVREREFAEAFTDPESRALYSICAPDYSAALEHIAQGFVDQLKPGCFPGCALDGQPETPVLDPDCALFEYNFLDDTQQPLPVCLEVNGSWTPPAGATACYAALVDRDGQQTPSKIDDMAIPCVDEGFNLEFQIIRTTPAALGSEIHASCALSPNKAKDCPNL